MKTYRAAIITLAIVGLFLGSVAESLPLVWGAPLSVLWFSLAFIAFWPDHKPTK